jgi:hypothetical protein
VLLSYEGWLKWRGEYYMKDNDLPAGVSCEIKDGGLNNNSSRIIKLEYLQDNWKTVAKINKTNEYEIVPSKYCQRDEIVWVLEADNTFTKTKIF